MPKITGNKFREVVFEKEEEQRLLEEKLEQEAMDAYYDRMEWEEELKEAQKREDEEKTNRKRLEKEEKNKNFLKLDSDYEKAMDGERRYVGYDEHYDLINDK